VLDAATQMLMEHAAIDELRHVLYKLMVRFKTLGITSVVSLESPSLYSTEHVTELGLSPIADNIVMLRYRETDRRLAPTLTIVKTRGSDHDRGTHSITVGKGGLRIETPPPTSAEGR
jgi:circadian clock protein KaiC